MSRVSAFTAALLACAAAAPAYALSDREVVELTVENSSVACPGFRKEVMTPLATATPVGALRVLLKNAHVICPDGRLDAQAPVVWYGDPGVFAWNPDVAGADKALIARIDAITRTENFPTSLLVWDAQGKALKEQVVPRFEARPGAYVRKVR